MKQLSKIYRSRLMDSENRYVHEVLCFFQLLGLREGNYWSTSDYMNWLTNRQREFQVEITKRKMNVPQFWPAFSAWLDEEVAGDTYILYHSDDEVRQGATLKALKKMGLVVNDLHYTIAWSGKLENDMSLETLVKEFNADFPSGYHGHKIDIGDVLVINQQGKRSAWYLNGDGFVRLNGFGRQKWGDKNLEEKAVSTPD